MPPGCMSPALATWLQTPTCKNVSMLPVVSCECVINPVCSIVRDKARRGGKNGLQSDLAVMEWSAAWLPPPASLSICIYLPCNKHPQGSC